MITTDMFVVHYRVIRQFMCAYVALIVLMQASMSTRNLSTRPTLVKQDDCSDQHHGLKAQPGTDSRGSNGLSPTKTERKSPKPRSERVTNSMQIDPRFSKAYSQYIRPLVPITERQHPAQRLVPPMLQSDLQKVRRSEVIYLLELFMLCSLLFYVL